jgi:hypothetical protein
MPIDTSTDRVWRHWKSLKRKYAIEGESTNSNSIWLTLARVHKMPVRKIKDLINARRGPLRVPVYCCEDFCYVVRYVNGERNGTKQLWTD